MATKAKGRPKSPAEQAADALGHWVRIEALTIFNERVASPKEISDEIGMELNIVGYHVDKLMEWDCIELVTTLKRGGAVEHFYRGVKRAELSDEEWLALPDSERRKLSAGGLRNMFAEGLASNQTGKMSADPYMSIWWKAANLDGQGREEAAKEQIEHIERLLEIEAKSAARMVESGEEPQAASTVIGVLGFTRSRSGQPKGDVVLGQGKPSAR